MYQRSRFDCRSGHFSLGWGKYFETFYLKIIFFVRLINLCQFHYNDDKMCLKEILYIDNNAQKIFAFPYTQTINIISVIFNRNIRMVNQNNTYQFRATKRIFTRTIEEN